VQLRAIVSWLPVERTERIWPITLDIRLITSRSRKSPDVQVKSVHEDEFGSHDGRSLKVDCLPGIVTKILNIKHRLVGVMRSLRHNPFEVCKEWRIVERPF
jgi:hypothetical protein